MLDINIVAFGKLKDNAWRSLADEYLKRIKPYARIRVEELKSEAFSRHDHQATKNEEGERLLGYLSRYSGAAVFLLSEKGEELDSFEFARKIDLSQKIILVVGGSLGFSENIFNMYPKISLGRLTFPHEMARVVLLEQIYRATTILNKKDYHY